MNKSHINLQRQKEHAPGLHTSSPSPLFIYYGLHFNHFYGFFSVQASRSLILCLYCAHFHICLSCSTPMLSFYFITLCYTLLHFIIIPQKQLVFLVRDRKEVDFFGWENGVKLIERERGDIVIRIFYVRKLYLFSIM